MSRLSRYRARSRRPLVRLLSLSNASAHCFVGARFFPATLAIDDPCVADEMSLPTVGWSKTGDVPPATEWDMSAEISKRITEDLGISIGEGWTQIRQPGGPTMAGFGDLETTLQYQLLKDDSHELAMLLGLIVDWGGTGATNAGIGTPYSVLTPTYYFGQGFGRLPETSNLRGRSRSPDRSVIKSRPPPSTWSGHQHPAGARLRRVAAIQHALPEIRGERPSAPRFHQSPDPDCRNAVHDAGRQQFRQLAISPPARSIRA